MSEGHMAHVTRWFNKEDNMPQAQDMDEFYRESRRPELEATERKKRFVKEYVIPGKNADGTDNPGDDRTYLEWRPQLTTKEQPDINIIRLGPPAGKGAKVCFVYLNEHSFKVGDEFVRFICPKTLNDPAQGIEESCPACDEQYKLYRESRDTGNEQVRQRANDMRAKTYAIFAILDKANMARQEGKGRVPNWQLMKIGAGVAGTGRQTTFGKLSGKFERFGDLSHPTEGRWVRVVYTQGKDNVTGKQTARFGDWDFEPADKKGPLGNGYEVGLPDLRLLKDPSGVPTAEMILQKMGMSPEGEEEEVPAGIAGFGAETEEPDGAPGFGGSEFGGPDDGPPQDETPAEEVATGWETVPAETKKKPVPAAVAKRPAAKAASGRGRR